MSPYISHNTRPPNLSFYEHRLASIPSLKHLADTRQCRVIHDMAAELPQLSEHSRWLLQHRWRSSYTVPLPSSRGSSPRSRCGCWPPALS